MPKKSTFFTLLPGQDRSRPRSESIIILERPPTDTRGEDGITVTKEMTRVRSYSSQIIRPGKGLTTPPIKSPCPASPLKLLVGADGDYHSRATSQCNGKENLAVSTTGDVGTKQILNLAEGMVTKRPSSAGPTGHNGSGDHSSKLKSVEASSVSFASSVYTPNTISLGAKQSQPKTDKEFNTVMTYVKKNALNRHRVQDTMQEHYLQDQPLKTISLRRNTSPVENKLDGRNVHQIFLAPLSSEECCLQKSSNQQRSSGFSVSSDKSYERQRTGSFAGGKREHVLPLIKPSSHLNAQDLHKNAQVRATEEDPSQTGATSTPDVLNKPIDLITSVSADQERGDSPANKTQDMTVETQEGGEKADKATKGLKMRKEQKEEISASDVKLNHTSQSEGNVKQFNSEVRSTPWLPKSTTPAQNDSKVGPVREKCSVLKSPPLYNTELFISAEAPVFSNIQPQSARRDQERAGLIRFPGKSFFLFYKIPFRRIWSYKFLS